MFLLGLEEANIAVTLSNGTWLAGRCMMLYGFALRFVFVLNLPGRFFILFALIYQNVASYSLLDEGHSLSVKRRAEKSLSPSVKH